MKHKTGILRGVDMEFNTRQELYDYLDCFDFDSVKETELSSVYFLVEFDNHVEPIYFASFDGAWFESDCMLSGFPLDDDGLMEYVKEKYYKHSWQDAYKYENTMMRNGMHYCITNWQCAPFLPDKIKIIDVFSDGECLDWLLSQPENTEEQNIWIRTSM